MIGYIGFILATLSNVYLDSHSVTIMYHLLIFKTIKSCLTLEQNGVDVRNINKRIQTV